MTTINEAIAALEKLREEIGGDSEVVGAGMHGWVRRPVKIKKAAKGKGSSGNNQLVSRGGVPVAAISFDS